MKRILAKLTSLLSAPTSARRRFVRHATAHVRTYRKYARGGRMEVALNFLHAAGWELARAAVTEHPDPRSTIADMEQVVVDGMRVGELLELTLDTEHRVLAMVRAGQAPQSVIYESLAPAVFSHLAELLNKFEIAKGLANYAALPEVQIPPAKLWTAYSVALRAAYAKEQFVLPSLRLVREDKTIWPYIVFMHRLVCDEEIDSTVVEIDQQFHLRNTKKGLATDMKCVDGDAYCPVKWNLRKHALLSLAKRLYSREIDHLT